MTNPSAKDFIYLSRGYGKVGGEVFRRTSLDRHCENQRASRLWQAHDRCHLRRLYIMDSFRYWAGKGYPREKAYETAALNQARGIPVEAVDPKRGVNLDSRNGILSVPD